MASDRESMQIWSTSSSPAERQSVRYVNGLENSLCIAMADFEYTVDAFIEKVINRLHVTNVSGTDLANLWREIQEERNDLDAAKYRRLEAEMGYDPDECPEGIIQEALRLAERIGDNTLSELTPVCSSRPSQAHPLSVITEIIDSPKSLEGKPGIAIPPFAGNGKTTAPWQRAKELAKHTRDGIGYDNGPISTENLCDFLGIDPHHLEEWSPPRGQEISLGSPSENGELRFHLRKRHPIAKRLELARLLGDYLYYGNDKASWLASTDLRTSRQKYQRAFAAEFLSPLDGLQESLNGDYSESAMEDAAEYYQVSPQTVESMLANNGLISLPQAANYLESAFPY